MDRYVENEVFVHVAELGSLSLAAESLGISTSAVSRHLMALETRLNCRLVQRTTRSLYLTSEGEQFLSRSRDALNSMREAEASVSTVAFKPTGLLRVSASLSFCLLHLAPLIPEFTARYPGVTVEIIASNRYYDLIENGVDIAIRTRRVETDSSITIRRLAETRRLVAASPAYLEANGTPRMPEDIADHKLLLYTLADSWNEMKFQKDGETRVIPVTGLLNSNDGQVLRAAALRGVGILFLPTYIIKDDLDAGTLVRVLDDWDLPRLTMNIAFPTKTHLPAKTRLFVDFLVQTFRENHVERDWIAYDVPHA